MFYPAIYLHNIYTVVTEIESVSSKLHNFYNATMCAILQRNKQCTGREQN